ncbi:CGLD27 family protein [Phormidium sp. CCY1219]|uniref:CGLD27 family protein n=1 Tax=Phormidium sp. CCY1219 TaxID=2886104 RepID=UPI002D1EE241|nr:CGLD27 family protein [Phormidium sp. CCY1219]MEB3831597.1 CGLD27 family protein [Phormidium sp. CCY1219]
MRETTVSVCPVPTEQQPLNEYQALKESCFFGWATRDLRGYLSKMGWILGISSIFCAPVVAASFPPGKYLGQFILGSAGGGGLILSLALLRLYLGWRYVRDRLASEIVSYEESGWYDGQTWPKTPEIITRDRLVVSYQIQPILQRVHRTFATLGILAIGGIIIWKIL